MRRHFDYNSIMRPHLEAGLILLLALTLGGWTWSQYRSGSERTGNPSFLTDPFSDAVLPTTITDPGDDLDLTIAVWQSAWGDFKDLEALLDYTRRNGISEVLLNLGLALRAEEFPAAYRKTQRIVTGFRRAGVKRVSYLYAERMQPIAQPARFLKLYPDLGMTTIIDDSEFTDAFLPQFRRNWKAVTAHGLVYGSYVTLESAGNSGVSDQTREFALRELECVILMSYFGCTIEQQRKALAPYLAYADSQRRVKTVKIAILMGTKKVGRERSCEMTLPEPHFQRFLRDLHVWARHYRSYAGLVLQSNKRLPIYEVNPRPALEHRATLNTVRWAPVGPRH